AELAGGLRGERTARELRLTVGPISTAGAASETVAEYSVTIPGEIDAESFGIRLRIDCSGGQQPGLGNAPVQTACLRNWRPGDRVRLRHSGSPRKVKEVLERLRVTGPARARWPVLEAGGRIVWMKGVELEPEAGITVAAESVEIVQDQGLP
ncbi:MAG: tRNA lysidine(34) synthetase TilS, partial [Terracidiphilus sp.]